MNQVVNIINISKQAPEVYSNDKVAPMQALYKFTIMF